MCYKAPPNSSYALGPKTTPGSPVSLSLLHFHPLSSLLSSPLPPPSSSYQPCSTSTKAMLTRKAARIPQTMPNSLRLTIIPLLAYTIHAYNTMCSTHLHRTTVNTYVSRDDFLQFYMHNVNSLVIKINFNVLASSEHQM